MKIYYTQGGGRKTQGEGEETAREGGQILPLLRNIESHDRLAGLTYG